ncbi:MAG TPA: cupin [Actinopolymorphaceae bacterium]
MTDPRAGAVPLPFPGAVGISHISAYDWPAADGVCSGAPHLHLACTEAYVVTHGQGALQTLTLDEGYGEVGLEPGVVAWFAPGTIHRMVDRGGLRVAIVMQNNGLPEAGDAVLTFPPEVVADPRAYAAAAALPTGAEPVVAAAARRRRDLAVEGFVRLRNAVRADDLEPLREFHQAAVELVAPHVDLWRKRWEEGPLADARRTGELLDALADADPTHLTDARVRTTRPTRSGSYGMCGRRDEYDIGS